MKRQALQQRSYFLAELGKASIAYMASVFVLYFEFAGMFVNKTFSGFDVKGVLIVQHLVDLTL